MEEAAMDIVKKFFRGVGGVIHIVTGTVFSYLGILSNILGTIMGILASLMTIGIIAGICVYVNVLPMFTEAREVVFDKMVHMS